ncbi:MAG: hypothetical protein IKN18_03635 [Neisseriaceae bacterium]|nr:hypothetical protein [Neisseriaceae bacterium]
MSYCNLRQHAFVIKLKENLSWDDKLYWDFEDKVIQAKNSVDDFLEFKKNVALLFLKVTDFNSNLEISISNREYTADDNELDKFDRFRRFSSLCECIYSDDDFDPYDEWDYIRRK